MFMAVSFCICASINCFFGAYNNKKKIVIYVEWISSAIFDSSEISNHIDALEILSAFIALAVFLFSQMNYCLSFVLHFIWHMLYIQMICFNQKITDCDFFLFLLCVKYITNKKKMNYVLRLCSAISLHCKLTHIKLGISTKIIWFIISKKLLIYRYCLSHLFRIVSLISDCGNSNNNIIV